jgi:hypothetical protein
MFHGKKVVKNISEKVKKAPRKAPSQKEKTDGRLKNEYT